MSYIDKYNCKGIEFPAGPKNWKKFEQNNKEITYYLYHTMQKQ